MKTTLALGVLALLAAPAAARQEDPTERMGQMLIQFLGLDEAQGTKAKAILKKQAEELRAVLTDEQKQRYDQMGRMFGGGGRGAQGGFSGRGGGAWMPSTDELKTQLTLNEDQVAKINEIRDASRQDIRNFWQNRQGGAQNPGDEWTAFQNKLREETTKKISALLTDAQKPKFDEILRTFQAQQPPQDTGRGGGRRGGSVDERVTRAMEALAIQNAQEADAVKGLVRKVVELMEKQDAHQRDSRPKLEELSANKELTEEAVGDKLDEIRKGYRDIDKDLTAVRKELAEVVTARQEVVLLRQGILR